MPKCLDLAARWDKARNDDDLTQFSPRDISNFSSIQTSVFLDKLGEGAVFRPATVRAMDELYSLDKQENAEIKLRFYKIALKSGPEYADSAASGCTGCSSWRKANDTQSGSFPRAV